MGCGKDLAERKELLVIKEIGKIKTNKSVAGRINRCVMTEIGEKFVHGMVVKMHDDKHEGCFH